jgi:hypothetical protein
MTIVTVLSIPEGFVLGADTQTTIYRDDNPVNALFNGQKIFDISFPEKGMILALSQFGLANPGGQPLSSHIYSIRELLRNSITIKTQPQQVAEMIIKYFTDLGNLPQLQGLGFYLVGFIKSGAKFEKLKFLIGFTPEPQLTRYPQEFGLRWSGSGAWIISKLLNLSDESQGIPPSDIPYAVLTLKDGVECTQFLISTVIGFEKFQAKFPMCGGSPRIALLTPREFRFLNLTSTDLFI